MTAGELVDGVVERIKRIPTLRDKTIDTPVIRFFCGRAFNQMLGDVTAKGYKNLTLFTKLCIGDDNTGIDVKLNLVTGIYYSEIPKSISPLVDIRTGVRAIGPLTNVAVEFHPMPMENIARRVNQTVSKVSNEIFYVTRIDNNGLVVSDYIGMTSNNNPLKVRMYLILPFEEYDEDDVLNIPVGQDKVFMDLVVSMLQDEAKKDVIYLKQNG